MLVCTKNLFTNNHCVLLDGAVQIRPRLSKLLKQGKTKDEGQSMVTLNHLVTLMNLMNLTSSTTATETTHAPPPPAFMAGGEATTPQLSGIARHPHVVYFPSVCLVSVKYYQEVRSQFQEITGETWLTTI